jgi:8-hydroxy-5-deazaflavin:NADPH oxidoreductase
MNITTIGRGAIGGTLGRLWSAAGHEVTELGRDGGDVGSADVVLLAVPYGAVPDALAGITGWSGQVVIDATNRLGGEHPPEGHTSAAEYVKATTGAPVAKAFNSTSPRCSSRPPAPRTGPATSGPATRTPARPSSSSAATSVWSP